jgi:hypothetical protein
MADRNETFPEKTYKHFITSGILRYPVPHMEMVRAKLEHAAEENGKSLTDDSPEQKG